MHLKIRLLLMLMVAALIHRAAAQPLTQRCPAPRFPGKPTAIDTECGITGSAGLVSPDGLQNARKNDFCAEGTPASVTAAVLKSLQTKTESAEQKAHIQLGKPPTDRSFLAKLGEGDLVSFEGFVFEARQECQETVNCGTATPNADASHDIHISLLDHQPTTRTSDSKQQQDAEECTSIVAEMVPHHRPPEWTACNVNELRAKGLRVRISGQRFFDGSHLTCIGGAPQGLNPKRASLWEIHPIYTFDVCPNGDCKTGGWVPLKTFANGKTICENKPCEEKPAKKN